MKIDKSFVSSIDKSMNEFDRTHTESRAQKAESKKYKHIYNLRDHAIPAEKKKDIWD